MALLAVFMALWGGLLYVFIKGRKEGSILPDSRSETCCLIFLAVLLRQILLLYEVSFWGNALPCATDEPGYFKTVYDMLQGNFAGPWNFTVGLGLIYLPFVWLTGAREFYDIAIAFTYFDGFVIAPAALGIAFLVLKGFGVKKYYAFAAVLLWALYPFFVYHAELWGKLHFAPLLALPSSFDGVADWQDIAHRLKRHDFQGPLTFELKIHNKHGRPENAPYAQMGYKAFMVEAYKRACRVGYLCMGK